MTIIAGVALALMANGPVAAVPGPQADFDVGYEELLHGRDLAALEAIDACEELAADDPMRLINRGIALARLGRYEEARADFRAVIGQERVQLETASGDWIDSRRLAHKAIAMLDQGEFARYYALSMR